MASLDHNNPAVLGWMESFVDLSSFRNFFPALRSRRVVFTPPDGLRTRPDIQGRLQALTDAFAASHAGTEPHFVELSRALRGLYTNATTLASLVNGHLDAMRLALSESHIAGPNGMAETSLRKLQTGLDETSRQLGSLQNVAEELRRLRVQVADIERVGVFIFSSVFGFAVESARTTDCQLMFGSFVSELRALAARLGISPRPFALMLV